jgi:hypothetical protein
MAKKKRRKESQIQKEPAPITKSSWSSWQLKALGIGVVLFILVIQHAPMVFDGLSPIGTDIIGGKGGVHQIQQFEKETGERPLWNPYVFSGMPVYHRLRLKGPFLQEIIYWFADTDRKGLNAFINYCIGGIGMFLLVQLLGVPLWGSVLAALAFVLMPHFEVLIQAGHFNKFRAIMLIPWVYYSFLNYFKSGSLLTFLLCILFISLQLHTLHYQIIFYTFLILLFTGVYYIIHAVKTNTVGILSRRLIIFVIAIGMALVMKLKPIWPVQEYTPYSIRGGTGEVGSKGLDFNYATGWSFSPKEMISLLIPNAYGGASIVTYRGKAVPQLKGRQIPGYWGDMPSTEGGEYVGILTFILGIIGIFYAFRQKQGEWIALALFIPFALLLSFGRHVPLLYKLFFEHVPVFNKFRVPSMILVTLYFLSAFFAGLGIKALFTERKEQRWIGSLSLGLGGFLVLLALVPFLFKGLFSFEKAGEMGSYGKQVMDLFKAARYDLFKGDAIRLLLLAIPGCAVVWLFVQKIIPSTVAWVALSLLILADFMTVDKRFLNNLGSLATLEASHFARTPTDRFLNEDTAMYRVFALEQDAFQDNQMSYYHQSVGGYNPAKLRIYQDVIENCIYGWTHSRLPINWHVLDMLNTKYIVAPGLLEENHLEMVFQDARNKKVTYRNLNNPGRAWFIGTVEQITDRNQRLQRLNDPDFHPDSVAILEKTLPVPIQKPGNVRAEVTLFEPNRIEFQVYTDVQALLVISEIYYPKGWTTRIDGEKTEIFKTDHILRSVVVPQGEHLVQMEFAPESYRIASTVSVCAELIFFITLLGAVILNVTKRPVRRG